MARSIRGLIESVVFAGLKPGAERAEAGRTRWLGPLREPVERFFSGGTAPSDPLYLSRRTPRQKLVFALKLASPFVVVGCLVVWAFKNSLFHKDQPKLDMSPAELAARYLPNFDQIKVETNNDVEIPSVAVDRSGLALTGTVKNNTLSAIANVEVTFEVTDENGSKLGAVKGNFQNLAPRSQSNFRVPIQQPNAAIAIVRDIRKL